MMVLVYIPIQDEMVLRDVPKEDIIPYQKSDKFCIGYQLSIFQWLYSTDLLLITTNLDVHQRECSWSRRCIESVKKIRAEMYNSIPEDVFTTIPLL